MPDICLPSLGADMDEGTLLDWYVKPGDRVEYGDIVALLDTEKAEIEMEAFVSGTVESLLVEPGEIIAVGTPMATLRDYASDASDASDASPRSPATQPRPAEAALPASPSVPPAPKIDPVDTPDELPVALPASRPAAIGHARTRATPLARRLARERGIDLARLEGSGPGGAITEADIPPGPARTHAPARSSRAERRQEIMAAAMTRSKREIPHYYLSTTIDIQDTVDWLSSHNRTHPVAERILLPALLMKSVARAVGRFPEMNGHRLEDGFHPSDAVHLGMVVSLRTGGLVVPTFRNADERSVSDLMNELGDVVGRARAGRLRSGELTNATITLTSLGDGGAETIFGVIYPPQVAIVGFGGVHPAAWAEGDLHGTRSVIRASLAADHRASDGQQGSRFLAAIERALRDPENL